jgi:DNA-binding CsgD family transcriptional regulator
MLKFYRKNPDVIEKLSKTGLSMLSVYDLTTCTYLYLNPHYDKLLGNSLTDPDKATGVSGFYDRVHPDDLKPLIHAEIEAYTLLHTMPADIRADYKVAASVRVTNHRGGYTRVLRRVSDFCPGRDGKPWLLLIAVDILENEATNIAEPPMLYHTSYKNIYPLQIDSPYSRQELNLSPRELEVLHLAGEGYTTKVIAEKLFLSFHTVSAHRKKIMRNFSIKNMQVVYMMLKLLELF